LNVHPNAAIDPAASIGMDVEIGPYCVIGPDVTIGDRCRIQAHAIMEGTVRVGARNLIGYGAVIGTPPQDLAFEPSRKSGVEIGDDNVIREYATIHRGTAHESFTRLGNGNYLMVGAHVGHNCSIGNKVIIANNCLLGGYVSVGDGAFLGGGSVFHQFMRIGRLAITQGNSSMGQDIPPFVIAAEKNRVFGLNAVGVRRAGVGPTDRDQIKAAFRLIYSSGHNIRDALDKARTIEMGPLAQEFIDFVATAKKRGICRYERGQRDPEL
jgi:UDP-N-acetylglucosamine acyltransferase